jgi:hypothetical protein
MWRPATLDPRRLLNDFHDYWNSSVTRRLHALAASSAEIMQSTAVATLPLVENLRIFGLQLFIIVERACVLRLLTLFYLHAEILAIAGSIETKPPN